ncbi:multiubiquitin domain-containing protein [Mycolicibacterium moriokaense]|uniref:Multiubiquitin n=1 Tax=Mycolicibacterium moriokaense TaxID=39691 RepID=A0A318HI09_9MYCO|nr:multiubiquitin domain-containing protein [Mycolicibacterium moriokaense]PXX09233.1 multiubiquitin [Mycolicibacterium moriokaense]
MPANTENEPPVQDAHGGPTTHQLQIIVNGQPVVLTDRHQTGAALKQAAIAQGVPIQADFVLSEVLHNGNQKVIPDDTRVTVKDGDEFWAIPGDDNS